MLWVNVLIYFKLEHRRKKELSVWGSLCTWWLGSSSPGLAAVPAVGGERGSRSLDACPARPHSRTAPASKPASLTLSACGNAPGLSLISKEIQQSGSYPENLHANWVREAVGDVLAEDFIDSVASYCPVRQLTSLVRQQPLGLQLLIRLLVITAWSLQVSKLGGPSCTNPLVLTVQDKQKPFSAWEKAPEKTAVT